MSTVDDVVETMCDRYQAAVTPTTRGLFASDAIRIPPGSEPEHGPDEIAKSEQKDYDVAKWSIRSRPLDALRIDDDWVYGIAHVDATTLDHADGTTKSFMATKTWLLHRQASAIG